MIKKTISWVVVVAFIFTQSSFSLAADDSNASPTPANLATIETLNQNQLKQEQVKYEDKKAAELSVPFSAAHSGLAQVNGLVDKIQGQVEAVSSLNEIVEGRNPAYGSKAEASDVVWGQSPMGTVPGDILLGFTQNGNSYNIYDYTSDGKLKSFAVAGASAGKKALFKDIAYDATGRPTAYIKEEHFGKWILSTTKWSGEFSGDGKLLNYTKVVINSKGVTTKDSHLFTYDTSGRVKEFVSNGQKVGLEYNDKGQVVKQVAYEATAIAGEVKDVIYTISYKKNGDADKIFVHVDGKAATKKNAGYTAYDAVIDASTGKKLSESMPQALKPTKKKGLLDKIGDFVGNLARSLGGFGDIIGNLLGKLGISFGKVGSGVLGLKVGGIVGDWFGKLEDWWGRTWNKAESWGKGIVGRNDDKDNKKPTGPQVVEKITDVQAVDDTGKGATSVSGDVNSFASGAARVSVGNIPQGVAITPDESTAVVANNGSNSISVVTLKTAQSNPTRKVEDVPLSAGDSKPDQVTITSDGKYALVSVARNSINGKPNSIAVLDLATKIFLGTIEGVGTDIQKIAISTNGTRAYVSTAAGIGVVKIDAQTIAALDINDPLKNRGTALAGLPINTPAPVLGISGQYILTSNGVYLIDASSLTLGQAPLYSGSFNKISVSIDEKNMALLNSAKGELIVVDIADKANPKLYKTIVVGAGANDMILSSDGTTAFVLVGGVSVAKGSNVLGVKGLAIDIEGSITTPKVVYEFPTWKVAYTSGGMEIHPPSGVKNISRSITGRSIVITDNIANELIIFDSEGMEAVPVTSALNPGEIRNVSGNVSDFKIAYNLATEPNASPREKGMSLKPNAGFNLSQSDFIFGVKGDCGTFRIILIDKNGNKARLRVNGISDLTKWKEIVIPKDINIKSSVFDRASIREIVIYFNPNESARKGTLYLDLSNNDGFKDSIPVIASIDATTDAPTFANDLNNALIGVTQVSADQNNPHIGDPAAGTISAAPIYYTGRNGTTAATDIAFDLTKDNDTRAVFALRLNKDLSTQNQITFYIDTLAGQTYPSQFTIELKDSNPDPTKVKTQAYLITNIKQGSNKITLDITSLSFKNSVGQAVLVLDPKVTGAIAGSFRTIGLFEPPVVGLAADDNATPVFIPVKGVAAFEVNDQTPTSLEGISTGYLYPTQGVTTRRLTTIERFIDYDFTKGEKQKGISYMFYYLDKNNNNNPEGTIQDLTGKTINFYTKGGATLPRQFYVFIKDIKGNTAHVLINGQDTNYNKASLDISKLSEFKFKDPTTGTMEPLNITKITEIGILLDKDLVGADLAGRLIIDGIEEIKEFSSSPSVGIDATQDAPTFINGMNNSIIGVTQVGRSSISKDPSNNPTIQAAPVYDITRTGVTVATDIAFNLTLDDDSTATGEQHDTRAVFALRLNKDLSTQNQITFYVDTLTGQTYPPEFMIELKDSNKNRTAIFYIKGIQPGSNKITLDITNFQFKNDVAEIVLVLDPKVSGVIAGSFRTIGLFEPAAIELAPDDGGAPTTFSGQELNGIADFAVGLQPLPDGTTPGVKLDYIYPTQASPKHSLTRERTIDLDLSDGVERGISYMFYYLDSKNNNAPVGTSKDLTNQTITFYTKGGTSFPKQFYVVVRDVGNDSNDKNDDRIARVLVTAQDTNYKKLSIDFNSLKGFLFKNAATGAMEPLDTARISEIGLAFNKDIAGADNVSLIIDGLESIPTSIASLDATTDAPTFANGMNNSITGVTQVSADPSNPHIGDPAAGTISAAPIYYTGRNGTTAATDITFDLTQDNDTRAVFALRLNKDLSAQNQITFYLDTIASQTYPAQFTIELKNSTGTDYETYIVTNIQPGSNKITLDITNLSFQTDVAQIVLVLDPKMAGAIAGKFRTIGLFEPAAVELTADDGAIPTIFSATDLRGISTFEVGSPAPTGVNIDLTYPTQASPTRRTTSERQITLDLSNGKDKGLAYMFYYLDQNNNNAPIGAPINLTGQTITFYAKGGATFPRQFYVFVKDQNARTAHVLVTAQDANYKKLSLNINSLGGFYFKNTTTGAMEPLDITKITEIGLAFNKDLAGADNVSLVIDGIEEAIPAAIASLDATTDAPTFANGLNNSITGVTQIGKTTPTPNTITTTPVYYTVRQGVTIATDITFDMTQDADARAVFALRLNKNLTSQNSITFYLDTLPGQAYPPKFTIELKNSTGTQVKTYAVTDIRSGSNKITLDISNLPFKNDVGQVVLVLDPKMAGAIAGTFRTVGLFEPTAAELAADDGNDPNTFPVYGTATFEIGSAIPPTGITTDLIHNGPAYITRRLGRERRIDVDLTVNDNEKGIAWLLFDPSLASTPPPGQYIQPSPGQGQDLRGKAIKFYLKGEGANFPDQFYLFVKDTAGRSARVAVSSVGSLYKMFTLDINSLSAFQLDTSDISEIGILFDKKLSDPQRMVGAILIDGIELVQTTASIIPATGDLPTLLNNAGNGALGTFVVVNPPPAIPIDTTPFISAKYVYDNIRGGMGAATEVTFDLTPTGDPLTDGKARGVYISRINKDFSAIPSLTFFVDTISGSNFPASFMLEFKNGDGTVKTSRLVTIQQGENEITVPLDTLLFKNDVGQISIVLDPAVAGAIQGKFRVHGLFEPATLVAQPDGGNLIGLSNGGGYLQMVAFAPSGGGSASSNYDESNKWRGKNTVEVVYNANGGAAYAVVEFKEGSRNFNSVQNILIPVVDNPSGNTPNQVELEITDGSGNTAVFLVTDLDNTNQVISVPLDVAVELTRSINPAKVLNRANIAKYTIRLTPDVISDGSKRAGRFNIVSVDSLEIGSNVPPPGGVTLPTVHPINFSVDDIKILTPDGNYLRGVQDANFKGMNKLFDLQTGLPFDIATINNGDVDQALSRMDPNQAKTSPSNIAMGLLSIIAMRDGGFIADPTVADAKVEKIVEQLEKMKKQNGFFYRYYSLIQMDSNGAPDVYANTDEIPTIDNGNLTAAMMMAREAVTDAALKARLDALIAAQNYNFFLNPGDTYLHGAYNVNSASLTTWGISDITDEGRNAALLGILLNSISDTAWTALNKMPTTYITQSGVPVSVGAKTWGGDVFPALFGSLLTGEEKLSPDQIGRNNKALTLAHIDTSRRLGYQFDSVFSPSEAPSIVDPANKYSGSGVPAVANNRQNPMQPNQVPLYAALLALRYTPAEAVNAIKRITALNPNAFSSQFGFVDSIDNTLVVNSRLLSLDKGMEVLTLHNILQSLNGTGATLDSYLWAYLDRIGKGAQGRSLIQGTTLY